MIKNITILHTFLLLLIGATGMLSSQTLSAQTIRGSVYGGGEVATIGGNTCVTINAGTIGIDIFGGGKGALNDDKSVKSSADIGGSTTVNINGGKFDVQFSDRKLTRNNNVYGGGNLACDVNGNTTVSVTAGMMPQSFFQAGGEGNSNFADWCIALSQMKNKPIQAGFLGAGYGKHTRVLGSTNLSVNVGEPTAEPTQEQIVEQYNICMTTAGTADEPSAALAERFVGNLLGGGYDGTVQQNTKVVVNGNPYIANIYGGGLGSLEGAGATSFNNETNVATGAVYDSEVGSVYGGTKIDVNGGIIVTNIYGGGAGIFGQVYVVSDYGTGNMPLFRAGMVHRDTEVNINGVGTIVFGNVFGGGDIANTGWYDAQSRPKSDHQDYVNANNVVMDFTTNVNLFGGHVMGDVFGGGNGRNRRELDLPEMIGAVIGNVSIRLGSPLANDGSGSKVWGSLYGGGQTGQVFSCAQMARNNTGNPANARSTEGRVDGCTNLEVFGGGVGHDLFGGGLGYVDAVDQSKDTAADIGGNVYAYFGRSQLFWEKYWRTWIDNEYSPHAEFADVSCSDSHKNTESDLCHNFYGGGNRACTIKGDVRLLLTGAPTPADITTFRNSEYFREALALVGMPHFAALGGGFGPKAKVEGDVHLTTRLGAGNSVVYVIGGGMNGPVNGTCYVDIDNDASSLIHNVYAGGYYAPIGKGTKLDIAGGTIGRNVFGGGVMGDIGKSANQPWASDGNGDYNSVTMNISGNTKIGGSVYGGNDVSGTVEGLIRMNITGATIAGNLFGAGNGDHIGYYVPDTGHYDMGENDNYSLIDHTTTDGAGAPKGKIYKTRPQTPAGVVVSLSGASQDNRTTILGQLFGGGNSCTIGTWTGDTFNGGGRLHITLGSHITLGMTNDALASASAETKDAYLYEGENVTGLYIGCSGSNLATQNKSKTNNYYHHYYDKSSKKYWPGFPVYADDGATLLTRDAGIAYFNRYMDNILLKPSDFRLNIPDNVTDLWMANFVGGGYRGSLVKATAQQSNYLWKLPAGVTVGNNVIGGAFNTDVVYRIFATTDGHEYTESDGQYQYLTDATNLTQSSDYEYIEQDARGNTAAIVRFHYPGGILDETAQPAPVTLSLYNQMQGGDVYGGCYASGTVGNTTIDYHAKGGGDVYGGGALANVNGSSTVNLLGGSLVNAYGGGLGRRADTTTGDTAIEALVSGDATVTLDGAVARNIFGCNNVNGTPRGQATVHVKRTVARDQSPSTYHLDAVYGGGNHAAYQPTDAESHNAVVIIEGCESSIENVYGGGNAAAVPGTDVTIYGGDIKMAFGGGNGQGNDNPGADVGYLGFYSSGNQTDYGSGNTNLTIYGGTINEVFGGSNTLGYIRTKATVNIDEMSDADKGGHAACPLQVGNVHGGGNNAPMYCDGVVNCSCIKGVDVLFAGSDNADIHGNIEMNITSGAYAKVFGGNNQGGNIEGSITINVDETGCWPVMIGELYGCGNDAPYSMYGYTDDGPRTKVQFDELTTEQKTTLGIPYTAPSINIVSATRIGRIFGGGKGEKAKVYGDITVGINMIKGRYAGTTVGDGMITIYKDGDVYNRREATDEERIIPNAVGTIESVFGGGDAAEVIGNTTVNIGTEAKAKHLNDNESEGETVGVNITGDVFGGGNKGQVTGSTNVKIGKE